MNSMHVCFSVPNTAYASVRSYHIHLSIHPVTIQLMSNVKNRNATPFLIKSSLLGKKPSLITISSTGFQRACWLKSETSASHFITKTFELFCDFPLYCIICTHPLTGLKQQ